MLNILFIWFCRSGAIHWNCLGLANSPHAFGIWTSCCIIYILPHFFLFWTQHGTGTAASSVHHRVKHWVLHYSDAIIVPAECGSLGPLFHRSNSYGYIIHHGTYTDNCKCEFFSQGWNTKLPMIFGVTRPSSYKFITSTLISKFLTYRIYQLRLLLE